MPMVVDDDDLDLQGALFYFEGLVNLLTAARNFYGEFGRIILDPMEPFKGEAQRFLQVAILDERRRNLPPPEQLGLPMDLDDVAGLLAEDPAEHKRVLSTATALVSAWSLA